MNKRNLTPRSLFIIGLIILNVLMIMQLPIQEGTAFFSLLHSDTNDTFMDFFNSIYDAGFENPYTERGVIYPPLTYLYYRLCGSLLPAQESAQYWKSSQSGMVLAMVMTAFSIYVLYKVLKEQDSHKESRIIVWILLGTVPFWYAIERGNLILQTLIFLAYFIKNYQSENAVKRELSLISLAIATAFKIYPACFGVLLLIDKRYKEALRCIVYGIVLFFLPFCFFGGLETAPVMMRNILATSGRMATRGWGYKVNIDNTISFLEEMLHVQLPYVTIFKGVVLLSLAVVLFFSHKSWQRYMALSAAMIIFPGFSYTYTLVFVAIPLLAFLKDCPKASTRNLLFSFLFLCMFAPFPFEGIKLFDAAPDYFYQLNLTTFLSSLSLLGIILLMPVDVVINAMENHGMLKGAGVKKEAVAIIRFLIILAVIIVILIGVYIYVDSSF